MTKSPKRTARVRTKIVQKHNLSPAADGRKPRKLKRLDVTPEEFFKAWSREDREALVEALIDSLDRSDGYSATEMEEDDADPSDATLRANANPVGGNHDDDEPSLGTTEHHVQTNAGLYGRDGWTTPADLEADDCDDEPSLASAGFYHECSRFFDQRLWAYCGNDDREGDPGCDDLEPSLCGLSAGDGGDDRDLEYDDSDMEPSLGWTAVEAACGRTCAGTMGRCFDLEEVCEDEGAQCDDEGCFNDTGVADTDGLLEQCAGHHHCGYGTSGFARAAI